MLDGALCGFRRSLFSSMSPLLWPLRMDFVQKIAHQILQQNSFTHWDYAFLRPSSSSYVLLRNSTALLEVQVFPFSDEILK
jgi:hypothetical protein